MSKNKKPESRFIQGTIAIESREAEADSRTIVGYIPFNKWSHNLGWFREKIDPAFFDGVMDQDTIAVVNHDKNLIMGRNKVTLELFKEPTRLGYRFEAPNSPNGDNLLESIKRKDITGSSFQFIPKSTKWEASAEEGIDEDRTLLECDQLIDIGPVTNPAYPDAEADMAKRDLDTFLEENPRKKTEPDPAPDHSTLERELELYK